MEFYPALERKEILTHPSTWMKPENIMLSEISQTQKDKYCMVPLTKNRQIHRDIKQDRSCQGRMEYLLGTVSFQDDGKVQEVDNDDG